MITTIIYLSVILTRVLADVSNSNDKKTSQNKIETSGKEGPARSIRDLNQLDKTNNGLDSAKGFSTDWLSNVPDFISLPTLDSLSEFSGQNIEKQGQIVTPLQSQDLLHSSLRSKANEQNQLNVADGFSIPSAFRNQPRISQKKLNNGLPWNDPYLRSNILNQFDEIPSSSQFSPEYDSTNFNQNNPHQSLINNQLGDVIDLYRQFPSSNIELNDVSQSRPEYDSTNFNQRNPYLSLNNNQFDNVIDLYRQFPSSNIELNDVSPYRPNQMPHNDPGTITTRRMDQYRNQMDQLIYPSSTNDHYLNFGRPYFLPERDMRFPSIYFEPLFTSRYSDDLSLIPRYTPRLDQHDIYHPRARGGRTIMNSRQQNRFPSRIQTQGQLFGSRFGRNLGSLSRDTYWDSN